MHHKLLIEAFKKAKRDTGSTVTKRQAQYLSDMILELSGQPFGERSLRDYYKAAIIGEHIELKGYIVGALASYLGYSDFVAFSTNYRADVTLRQEEKGKAQLIKSVFTGKHWLVMVILVIAITIMVVEQISKPRFMIWSEDHYVEVKMDLDSYSMDQLVHYDKKRIENFKKVDLECGSTFFNVDGSPVIWYGKNKEGELEFFTDLGKHPETGKTLKEITEYMIKKYICNSSN